MDFTWIHAGPAAARTLADHGAEVTRIESGNALAVVGGPLWQTPFGLGSRHMWNAGKLSVALNMKTPKGVEIAKRLVAVSDVVMENFSGRVLPSWGMDYESLRQIKPDIILLSLSGLGRSGVWKEYVSYGQTLQAWGGFSYLTGFPYDDPCGPASAYSDAVGAMAGAQAVLLALLHRERTGEGQHIDVAQLESLVVLLETTVLDASANGNVDAIQRTGNRLPHGDGAPHGAYQCQGEDRWVAIAVFGDGEWRVFCHAIGDPPWTQDKRFASVPGRQRHTDELDRLVETWTAQYAAEEVMELLQAAGITAGVVQSGEDLVERDEHMKERGFYIKVPDRSSELRPIEGVPFKLSRTPGGPLRGAPELGEHQTYVCRDLLGISDEELAQCAIEGVFE